MLDLLSKFCHYNKWHKRLQGITRFGLASFVYITTEACQLMNFWLGPMISRLYLAQVMINTVYELQVDIKCDCMIMRQKHDAKNAYSALNRKTQLEIIMFSKLMSYYYEQNHFVSFIHGVRWVFDDDWGTNWTRFCPSQLKYTRQFDQPPSS